MEEININGRSYLVGFDPAGGKDYAGVIIIGDSSCEEALAEIAQLNARGIGVICFGHIDEETKVTTPMPTGVKEIAYIPREPLIESYCPRKNDNKPWYSRFDKKKKR